MLAIVAAAAVPATRFSTGRYTVAMAIASKKFQSPKGTRDFYPNQMAIRRYIEGVWRKTSINHGFDEVEGPMFEHLELYTHKSGPGIVSELFQVFSGKDEQQLVAIRAGTAGAPYALRPEFTPTLARMVAAKAAELPRPIKWFAIPQHFRAERPQRGRLREFVQWNVDFMGDDSSRADAEVIACAIAALERLALNSKDITIRISHRDLISQSLLESGLNHADLDAGMALLDKRSKLDAAEFNRQAAAFSLDVNHFDALAIKRSKFVNDAILAKERGQTYSATLHQDAHSDLLLSVIDALADMDALRWCEFDFSIVRGLAYYTGAVFEIHEATGAERAIAGGGRYDNLIESFGGPSLPACGFGMGDVVLGNLLHDKGLLTEEHYTRDLRPDAFVVAADDNAATQLAGLVASLRKQGFHIRHSYKTTRNVGKLLGEANKSNARFAIILGKELAENKVAFKDLIHEKQGDPVLMNDLPNLLRQQQNET